MKYKVKENQDVPHAGEIGAWLGRSKKKVFLQFVGQDTEDGLDIRGYSPDEVELYTSPKKSESEKRKEDALTTIKMIRIEMSKHHSVKQEIDTLLSRLELEIGFIKVGEDDV